MGFRGNNIRNFLKLAHGYSSHQRCLFTKASLLNKHINICVEGNIGCGKTTLLQHLKALDGLVEIHEEPVNKWRDFCGENPLAKLYEDPSRWSFMLQSLVTLTLFQRHHQKQVKPIRLMERSVYSAQYFFTENLYNCGYLTDLEYHILLKVFEWEMEKRPVNIDLMIYLQTSPEVCLQRIKDRQRPEEQIVSLDYLRDLHELHERVLVKGDKDKAINTKVLVLNNNHDKKTMEKNFHEVMRDILCKVGVAGTRHSSPVMVKHSVEGNLK